MGKVKYIITNTGFDDIEIEEEDVDSIDENMLYLKKRVGPLFSDEGFSYYHDEFVIEEKIVEWRFALYPYAIKQIEITSQKLIELYEASRTEENDNKMRKAFINWFERGRRIYKWKIG